MQLLIFASGKTWCNASVNISNGKVQTFYFVRFDCPDVLSCNEPRAADIEAIPLSQMAKDVLTIHQIGQNARMTGSQVASKLMLCACGDTQEECERYCKVQCVAQQSPAFYGTYKNSSGVVEPADYSRRTPRYYCPKNKEKYDPFAMPTWKVCFIVFGVFWGIATLILTCGWLIIYRKHDQFTFKWNPNGPRIRCKEKKVKKITTLDKILMKEEQKKKEKKQAEKDAGGKSKEPPKRIEPEAMELRDANQGLV